jgi:hypothetical protein
MQEEAFGHAVLPNRKERRRQAAMIKSPVPPTCACCQPTPRDDRPATQPDGERTLAGQRSG